MPQTSIAQDPPWDHRGPFPADVGIERRACGFVLLRGTWEQSTRTMHDCDHESQISSRILRSIRMRLGQIALGETPTPTDLSEEQGLTFALRCKWACSPRDSVRLLNRHQRPEPLQHPRPDPLHSVQILNASKRPPQRPMLNDPPRERGSDPRQKLKLGLGRGVDVHKRSNASRRCRRHRRGRRALAWLFMGGRGSGGLCRRRRLNHHTLPRRRPPDPPIPRHRIRESTNTRHTQHANRGPLWSAGGPAMLSR